MEKTEEFLTMNDGFEIYSVCYMPESPRGHIHIVHGMAEHIGRYDEFAGFMVKHGFAVSGHDHRGHGKTAKRNGMAGYFTEQDGFKRVTEDLHEVINKVQGKVGELPLTLFGHSMGSFITRYYLQQHSESVARAVISGTGGDPKLPGKAGLLYASAASKVQGKTVPSPALTKMTFGRYALAFPNASTEFGWLTSNEEAIRSYINDPLSGFIPTNQFFVDLISGIFLIQDMQGVKKIRKKLPVLFFSGAQDPVGQKGKGVFESARQFIDAGIEDVTVYLGEEGRHELLNEEQRDIYMDVVLQWVTRDG